SANAPSYPVLVDPNGYWANYQVNTAWQDWVAGGPTSGFVLPRRVSCEPLKPSSPTPPSLPNFPTGSTMAMDLTARRQQLLRWTTLLDDMAFPCDVAYAGQPCRSEEHTSELQSRS